MIDPSETDTRQQRFIQRFMNGVPHLAALGIAYQAHGADWAELAMPFAEQQLADPDYGIIASGAIFTLMDSAAGFSVFVRRNTLEPHATLDLRLDYRRAPKPRATIIGRGECYRLTRQIAFVRGLAHDGDPADPIANMAGTFMFSAKPAEGMSSAKPAEGMLAGPK
ncbi:PaaI family thioesterase [Polymorphobacter multimanifer]|uniref:PaaI family thioesterase n=1 Tax=Polymorphobacter multimanifer TaxID=1070431 RepID=UPI001665538A|nr:PaaI family thioesterase [Polymorphobacter multimanifer]